MRYRLLGKSGLRVSELCLGTMTFGEDWGWGASGEESRKIFDAFVSKGGNFIDTANAYTNGSSEKLVGQFIASERHRYVLATKYTLSQRMGDPNASGNHRKSMVQALEGSLKRLGTDYVDLYWVHAWDFVTPVEEIMRALDDMVRAGKVLYVGVSDAPAWCVAQANTLADLKGWSRFVGLQVEYSLAQRDIERELLPMARALDIGVTAWGALAGGLLSGKYGTQDMDSKRHDNNQHRVNPRSLAVVDEVKKVAQEIDRTPSQVALAWVRQQAHVLPILGARKLSQLQDNLGVLDFQIGPEHLARLNKASAIQLGFPHDFLAMDGIRNIVFGGTYPLLDRK